MARKIILSHIKSLFQSYALLTLAICFPPFCSSCTEMKCKMISLKDWLRHWFNMLNLPKPGDKGWQGPTVRDTHEWQMVINDLTLASGRLLAWCVRGLGIVIVTVMVHSNRECNMSESVTPSVSERVYYDVVVVAYLLWILFLALTVKAWQSERETYTCVYTVFNIRYKWGWLSSISLSISRSI